MSWYAWTRCRLDFCADSADAPIRAYLIDTVNPTDQERGFNIRAIVGKFDTHSTVQLSNGSANVDYFRRYGKSDATTLEKPRFLLE
jgi:hypothetical protein